MQRNYKNICSYALKSVLLGVYCSVRTMYTKCDSYQYSKVDSYQYFKVDYSCQNILCVLIIEFFLQFVWRSWTKSINIIGKVPLINERHEIPPASNKLIKYANHWKYWQLLTFFVYVIDNYWHILLFCLTQIAKFCNQNILWSINFAMNVVWRICFCFVFFF